MQVGFCKIKDSGRQCVHLDSSTARSLNPVSTCGVKKSLLMLELMDHHSQFHTYTKLESAEFLECLYMADTWNTNSCFIVLHHLCKNIVIFFLVDVGLFHFFNCTEIESARELGSFCRVLKTIPISGFQFFIIYTFY